MKYMSATLKAASGGFDSIITTPRLDRDGEVVVPTGIRNRDAYMTNPMVFWAHEWAYNPAAEPVGKATRLDVFGDRIESSAEFAPTTKAQNVRALVEGGFVRRTSVGMDHMAVELRGGIPHVVAWDLLEYSIVPMPANTDATITGVKSALAWLADQMGTDAAVEPVELVRAAEEAQLDLASTPGGIVVRDGARVIATLRKRRIATLRH